MRILVVGDKNLPETKAVVSFLEWQTIGFEFDDTPTNRYEITKGKNIPVVFYGKSDVLVGFINMYEFFEQNGRFLA